MDLRETALEKHRQWRGKIETVCRVPLRSAEDLAFAYTPGAAAACLAINSDNAQSFQLTRRANTVAVVTDGSAVLGLGDIGAAAAMPVMEGKCALFKALGNVDAVPVCIDSQDNEDIVRTVKLISCSFGGINLEDISAPRCFEIERRLKKECSVPVFHDDQHGTAAVVLAALINSLKLAEKSIDSIRVVINGAGAAGLAIARLIVRAGVKNVILCDRQGAVYSGRPNLNAEKQAAALFTNINSEKGSLGDIIKGADVFIGVSAANCVTEDMVRSMAARPILFPLANPDPEITPDSAKAGGAFIVGTGRSDYPNQINNVLAFPGIFRGALDIQAGDITENMLLAAAKAIADHVKDDDLSPDNIIPSPLDKSVSDAVARAVSKAASADSRTGRRQYP